ncbi:Eco57I restriction-modification methylase domain-containing protein [Autumnicola musiva]|uniref:site-specific DNA-methyltransferase (adenine-specific) n=1 Tax=Autumnicola musiva TaxID=3075589 RepID=A0ABU3DBG2_9FLAO|nr:N-6 DNA methylase [Zunongwangia sp. F117]MDT0678303.1 N-6 DNA methylase [Zunongwangia sp. F117]
MALYQVSVLKKYLKLQDDKIIDKAYKKFTSYFQHPEIQENIRKSKEEQFQATFLSELFVNILGYKLNPNPNYNLTTEFKNDSNNRKADGAILQKGNAIGVIELKGTNTKHLEGIRQQAFDYKANQKNCVYVITSNFEKLRFYINDATEFLEFDLFELNRDDFGLLWLCLQHDNIMTGLPLKVKEASLVEEEMITKEFYKDYSVFKRELYRDLVKKNAKELKSIRQSELASESLANEEFQKEVNKLEKNVKLNLFKKSQKLIDRFLFVFFAEDRGLLPPNSIHKIIQNWEMLQDMDVEQSLYERYKIYFNYLNTGREAKGDQAEIFAYNGGLFKPDPILDMLKIDNELLLKHTKKLATYDFESQVDVNILGHIFENSLNEIESVNAEIKGADFDKQKSKRKKDGVFYTPKYITKYIVENTVGKLCNEKKSGLGFREEEYYKGRKRRKRETLEQLLKILDDYREWLLKLTICDPACGSGAFLNQALDFLIKEHRYIDEMHGKLLGGSFRFPGIENTILENNIYGVDINEESVEIARLSLWLRTAKPHRKLNDLSGNIKCGNSLIEEKKKAGVKAFKWEEEFKEVFKDGGFDVVIGNPPYIKEASNKSAFNGLHDHDCYQGKMDLWYFFGVLALNIIKSYKGLIGYIAPNNWITNDGAQKFRNYILQNGKLLEFIDFGNFKVFDSAGIQTMIYVMKKSPVNDEYDLQFSKISDSKINHDEAQLFLEKVVDVRFDYFISTINKELSLHNSIHFIDSEFQKIIEKINGSKNFTLESKEIASGIDILQDVVNKKHKDKISDVEIGDGIFNLNQNEYETLNLNKNEKDLIKPFYTTNEFGRHYGDRRNNLWVIYTDSSFKDVRKIEDFPNVKNHIDKFKEVLTSVNKPYGLHRSRDEKYFQGEKIFSLRKCSNRPTFTYTDFDAYVNRTFMVIKTNRIDLKCLTSLLNSNALAFWLKYKGKMQGDNYQIDKTPLMNIPVRKPKKEIETELNEIISEILIYRHKENDYLPLFRRSKQENNFDREIQLSKSLEEFKSVIQNLEDKINSIVYELYGLNQKEINIIEKNINSPK